MQQGNNWYSEISKYLLDVSKFTLSAVLIVELFKGFDRAIGLIWAICLVLLLGTAAFVFYKLSKFEKREDI